MPGARPPLYPEIVGAWQIYDAVLNHDVRALEDLDAYLVARGLPRRDGVTELVAP